MNSGSSETIARGNGYRAPDVADRVSAAGSVADQLASVVRSWSSKARNLGATTDVFVRTSPWRAAGAVALAGLAAGVLVSGAAERARRRAARGEGPKANSEVLRG
jgi:hypothetical protein